MAKLEPTPKVNIVIEITHPQPEPPPPPAPTPVYIPPPLPEEEPPKPRKPAGPPNHFCKGLGKVGDYVVTQQECLVAQVSLPLLGGQLGTETWDYYFYQGITLFLGGLRLREGQNFLTPNLIGIEAGIRILSRHTLEIISTEEIKTIPEQRRMIDSVVTHYDDQPIKILIPGGPLPSCATGYVLTSGDNGIVCRKTTETFESRIVIEPSRQVSVFKNQWSFKPAPRLIELPIGLVIGKYYPLGRFGVGARGSAGPILYLDENWKYAGINGYLQVRPDLYLPRLFNLLRLSLYGAIRVKAPNGFSIGTEVGLAAEILLGTKQAKREKTEEEKIKEEIEKEEVSKSPPESATTVVVFNKNHGVEGPQKSPPSSTPTGCGSVITPIGTPSQPLGTPTTAEGACTLTVTNLPEPVKKRSDIPFELDNSCPPHISSNEPEVKKTVVKADPRFYVNGKALEVVDITYTHANSNPLVDPRAANSSPFELLGLAQHQMRELAELYRARAHGDARVILSEHLIADRPLTSNEIREIKIEYFGSWKSIGEAVQKDFPNGIPSRLTTRQKMALAQIGTPRLYAALNRDVITLPAISPMEDKMVRIGHNIFSPHSSSPFSPHLLKSKQIDNKITWDLRENFAAAHTIEYLLLHPDVKVFMIYGNAHTFKRAFKERVNLTTYDFPRAWDCHSKQTKDPQGVDWKIHSILDQEAIEAALIYYPLKRGKNLISILDYLKEESRRVSDIGYQEELKRNPVFREVEDRWRMRWKGESYQPSDEEIEERLREGFFQYRHGKRIEQAELQILRAVKKDRIVISPKSVVTFSSHAARVQALQSCRITNAKELMEMNAATQRLYEYSLDLVKHRDEYQKILIEQGRAAGVQFDQQTRAGKLAYEEFIGYFPRGSSQEREALQVWPRK